MKYTIEIAPLYNCQIIHDLCEKIDEISDSDVTSSEMFKITLLSAMRNLFVGNMRDRPLQVYRNAIQRVKEDIITKSHNPELLIGYYPFT